MKIRNYLFSLFVWLVLPAQVSAQEIRVSGTVRDENGAPMVGVTIIDKNRPRVGTATDAKGRYTIRAARNGFLEYSFVGYETRIDSVGGRKVIDVTMKPRSAMVDEVVVIGYGTARKSDLTGAVSVVDMKSIDETPATSATQALQGRIAGVDILSGTGEPGETGSIHIRGARSISAGNEPLIVVDGVPDAVSDISEINPADIVSISVLKDVSSTAIYGTRGANGVILITTNDERPNGKFNAKFKGSFGISQLCGKLDIMNASEFAEWRNMLHAASSSSANEAQTGSSGYPFLDPSVYGQGTDWIDALSQTGMYQDYNVSLSGGTKATRASVSFGYNNTRGVVIGSGFERYTGRVNLESRLNKWLRGGLLISYSHQNVDRTNAKISGTDTSAAIFLSPLLGTADRWNTYGDSSMQGGNVFNNPYLCAMHVTNEAEKINLNIVPRVTLQLAKYWTLQSKLSYTRRNEQSFYYSPSYLPVAEANVTGGSASRGNWWRQSLLSETTLTWKRSFRRRHDVNIVAGFTAERTETTNETTRGTGYLDDRVTWRNMSGLVDARNLSVSSSSYRKTAMSVLVRANYAYRKRYHFTFTMRADGASNFSKGNKWGIFPAGAFRWSLSNEKFLKNTSWLDDLSLRLSAGRSGNDAIGSYMSVATLLASRGNWVFGDKQLLAYTPTRLANSSLTWETTDSYNAGINFAALNNRIVLEVDAYRSTTTDLLLAMQNAQTTGYGTYYTNIGKTRNTGIEATLTTRNVAKPKFTWSTTITLAHNTQLVVDAGNEGELVSTYMNPHTTTQTLYGYRNGYPVNALWGYQYAGVWHSEADIERNEKTHTYVSMIRSGSNGSNLGRPRYVDVNNDGVLDQNDMIYLGNSDPVIYGGFQNNFTICRNLSLSIYFTYSLGGRIYNLSELWMGSGLANHNKYRYMLDAWHPVRNPDSNIPIPNYDDAVASDRFVHDASYLRLKTLSLSYRFRIKNKKTGIESLLVGFSSDNLWLWKKYNGFDPDVSTSATVRRLDNGSYPRPRTFVFNLQITY